MNERIKELALQAGYEKDMFGIGHWDMPECKKFAELIVRECASIVEDAVDHREPASSYVGKIKEYFGVEQ
jgi:hypothetical protein